VKGSTCEPSDVTAGVQKEWARAVATLPAEGKSPVPPRHPWGDEGPETTLPHPDIADRLGIHVDDTKKRDALRARLTKFRKENPGGQRWFEVENPKPRQARYYVQIGAVWPLIEDMKPTE